eukprot:TRINITY_DN15023_c0_g1_i1.p1 TRINITY_DN15023_c0_g1~~TRINITY_DN15023_c0_g1_i1.p1  ORF type:complete len:152 (+),score=20.69 TRINITY_DN15023_c0_g1_i1:256-711(+)
MEDVGKKFAAAFMDAVDRKDHDTVRTLLKPDFSLSSPMVHAKYTDMRIITIILRSILELIPDFHYLNTFVSSNYVGTTKGSVGVVLHFAGTVLDEKSGKRLHVDGIDMFEIGPDGLAVSLRVMLRPLRSVLVVSSAMQKKVAAAMMMEAKL